MEMEVEMEKIVRKIKKYSEILKGDFEHTPKKLIIKNIKNQVEVSYLGGGDSFTDPNYYGDYLIKKGSDQYLLSIGWSEILIYKYNKEKEMVIGDPIYYRAAE